MESQSPKIVTKKHQARIDRERTQRKFLIFGTVAVIGIALLLLLYGILDQAVFQGMKAVATVGGEKITVTEFQERVRYQRWNLVRNYAQGQQLLQIFGNDATFAQQLQNIQTQLDNPVGVGVDVLGQMVDEILIQQEAARRGITVTDAEVEKSLQDAFGFYPDGTPTPTTEPTPVYTPTISPKQLSMLAPTATVAVAPTEQVTETPTEAPTEAPATPTATLDPNSTPAPTATPLPTATPYTQEGYKAAVKGIETELADAGVPLRVLRDVFRANLLRTKLFDAVTADVATTQEQVWAQHILFNLKDADGNLLPENETNAKAAYERLKAGEDWNAVEADVYKDNPRQDVGDLGWFTRGAMLPEFSDAAFALKEGEISEPVKTIYGWHIIRVLGHADLPLTADQLATARNTVFTDLLTKLQTDTVIDQMNDLSTIVPSEPSIPTN